MPAPERDADEPGFPPAAGRWRIKAEVEKADYVLLDWGAGIPWEKFSDYRDELYQLFENNFEKCFWFGATSDGSPKHPNFHGEKRLQKIEKSELKRIFYKK